jgi:hypothetical protein
MIGLDHAAGITGNPEYQAKTPDIPARPRTRIEGFPGIKAQIPSFMPMIPDYPSIPPDTEPMARPLCGYFPAYNRRTNYFKDPPDLPSPDTYKQPHGFIETAN